MKEKVRLNARAFEFYADLYAKNNFRYLQRVGNYTSSLIRLNDDGSKRNEMIFTNDFTGDFRFMHIAKEIKQHIDRTNPPINPNINKNDVFYYDGQGLHEFDADVVYNVDITGAYMRSGAILGSIPEQMYKDVISGKVDKKVRLKGFGAIASSYIVLEMRGNEIITHRTDQNEKYRPHFFQAAKLVGEIIHAAAQKVGTDFLFYWVDGIYLRSIEAVNEVKYHFALNGFDCKELTLYDVKCRLHRGVYYLSFTEPTEKGRKEFMLPAKDYYSGNAALKRILQRRASERLNFTGL